MTTLYVESQGTRLMRGDGASPESFTLVPQITSISGPDGQANEIDITTLDSTAKEFIMGLKDEGNLSLEMVFNEADQAQHAGLVTDRTNRTKRNWQLRFSDSPNTVLSFAGFVMTISRALGVDEVNRATVGIRISGDITVT